MNRSTSFHEIGDLGRLVDPEGALSMFHHAGLAIDGAEQTYLRVKPGESAIVGFLFHASATDGSDVSVPGYVRTFEEPARRREVLAKWRRMKPSRTPLGEGVRELPGSSTILFLFPNDMRIRGMRFVASMDKLKRILPEVPGLGGCGWRIRGRRSRLEIVRYKPERRLILRAKLVMRNDESGEDKRTETFLRFFTDSRGRRIDRVARELERSNRPAWTPRPLGTAFHGRIYLEEAVDGVEILSGLREGTAPVDSIVERLRWLHSNAPSHVPMRTSNQQRRTADLAIHALVEAGIVDPERGKRLSQDLATHTPAPCCPSLVHGDFHLHQVLITDQGPVFVDFERCALGDPLLDIGTLLAHLQVLARGNDGGPAATYRDRFLEAFNRQATKRPPADLAFHTVCGLMEMALLPYRRLEPDWEGTSLSVFRLAEQAFEELPKPSSSRTHRFDFFEENGLRVECLYPSRKTPWPGYALREKGRVYGFFDPDSLHFDTLDAKKDPLFRGSLQWLEKGTLLSYRPGRRALLKIGDTRESLFLKVLRPRKAEALRNRHRALSEARRSRPEGFPNLPELLAWNVKRGTFLYRRLAGTSLHDDPASPAIGLVAKGLALFHRTPIPTLQAMPGFRASDLQDWYRWVEASYPHLRREYGRALEQIDRPPADPASGPRPVHGDLHDKNIFVCGDRIGLLDLDSIHLGDPAVDVGNLAAHFVLRSLQRGQPAENGNVVVFQLISAYLEAGGESSATSIHIQVGRTLYRLACVYLYRRAWRQLAPALIQEALRWATEQD